MAFVQRAHGGHEPTRAPSAPSRDARAHAEILVTMSAEFMRERIARRAPGRAKIASSRRSFMPHMAFVNLRRDISASLLTDEEGLSRQTAGPRPVLTRRRKAATQALARELVTASAQRRPTRRHRALHAGIRAFREEGVALMCLAEALCACRTPRPPTGSSATRSGRRMGPDTGKSDVGVRQRFDLGADADGAHRAGSTRASEMGFRRHLGESSSGARASR